MVGVWCFCYVQYLGPPVAYIQQIVIKSVVSPWQRKRLLPTDAIRAPLASCFDIVTTINDFHFDVRYEAYLHF